MNQWRKKLRKKATKGIAATAGLMAFLILGVSVQAKGEVYREPVLSGTIETNVYVGEDFDEKALVNILTEPKNALVKQYKHLIGLDNVNLEITDDAVRAVARRAIELNTGARGLRTILENLMII